MSLWQLWLIGWVVTSLFIVVGANAVTDWSNDEKSKFSLRVTLLGIILWIPFIVILLGTMLGLVIRKKTQ